MCALLPATLGHERLGLRQALFARRVARLVGPCLVSPCLVSRCLAGLGLALFRLARRHGGQVGWAGAERTGQVRGAASPEGSGGHIAGRERRELAADRVQPPQAVG